MDDKIGVAAQVAFEAWAETALQMETLTFGRSADNLKEDCVLELTSRWLAYRIALRGGWIWLSVCLMDSGGDWEHLFNVGETENGWRTVRQVVLAFEREGEIQSLQWPIELRGGSGPNGFVIA